MGLRKVECVTSACWKRCVFALGNDAVRWVPGKWDTETRGDGNVGYFRSALTSFRGVEESGMRKSGAESLGDFVSQCCRSVGSRKVGCATPGGLDMPCVFFRGAMTLFCGVEESGMRKAYGLRKRVREGERS